MKAPASMHASWLLRAIVQRLLMPPLLFHTITDEERDKMVEAQRE